MSGQNHWQRVYESKAENEVSWFQVEPSTSLQLIKETGVARSAKILDVGGGASRLVDCLQEAGYTELGVLDITDAGLATARRRLGARANGVQWIVSDATNYDSEIRWDLWHDRAVFHFLVDASDRVRYRQVLERAVAPHGQVIIATFGTNGPERCSGLAVVRYGPKELGAEIGSAFTLRKSLTDDHHTPSGAVQEFLYCWFERTG